MPHRPHRKSPAAILVVIALCFALVTLLGGCLATPGGDGSSDGPPASDPVQPGDPDDGDGGDDDAISSNGGDDAISSNGGDSPGDDNLPDDTGLPGAGLPCITCHSAAMGGRRPVVDSTGAGGHHLGAEVLSNDDCLNCHDLSQHQQGLVRLWSDPREPGDADNVIELSGDPRRDQQDGGKLVPFCVSCHGASAHGGHPAEGDWQPTCVACHDLHDPGNANLSLVGDLVRNQTLSQDLPVVFTSRTGPGSFDDGDPTANDGICQVCHTTTALHLYDGSGTSHHDGTDCTACHSHANGFIADDAAALACVDCHSSPQGGRRAVVDASGGGGHHLQGSLLSDGDCEACHESTQHMQGKVRLWENPAERDTVVVLEGDPAADPAEADKLVPFCGACHDPSGHSVHLTGSDWKPACTACHDLHDPANSNLSLVRDLVYNQTLSQDLPVVFTSRAGANSFDDGDPAAADGICQVCHTATRYNRHDGGGRTHHTRRNCTTCHAHDEGFARPRKGTTHTKGLSCTVCHSNNHGGTLKCVGCHISPRGDRPVIVNTSGSNGHHALTDALNSADCVVCHEMSQHQAGTVRVWSDPNDPTTPLPLTGDPAELVPFCSACHDDATHPTIHTTGSGWEPVCTECHALHNPANANLSLVNDLVHNQTLSQDLPVVFTARTGANSFDDGDPAQNDGICQVCHTATIYHLYDGSGTVHNNGLDCTMCHAHDSGFIPPGGASCIGCHNSPQGARPKVVNADGTGGHHLAGGVLTDADCVVCHEMSQHQAGTVRVWSDPNDPTTPLPLTGDPAELVPFCSACHDDATHPTIHTTGSGWKPVCTECHELHDPSNANLSLVSDVVRNQTLSQDLPVVFTSRTGANSFDDGDPAANDGICQVCHTVTFYHLNDGSGAAHFNGLNCTMCHAHDSGFLPPGGRSCIGCHDSPQGARPQVVNADGTGGHHLAGGVLTDADCVVCHEQSQHRHGTVRLWSDPTDPTTPLPLTGDPAELVPFCNACHDDATHPTIHTTGGAWEPVCTECHELHDPANANLSLVRDLVHNQTLSQDLPVVFTARSGANSFDDGDPAANDGICQVCHTATIYHLYDGSGPAHNNGLNCTFCHEHDSGFRPPGGRTEPLTPPAQAGL